MSNSARDSSSPRVWDPWVRLSHWSLVVLVSVAWFTRHSREPWHEWAGYGVGALVVLRIVWGFVGGRHARFADFVRAPAATLAYARTVIGGRPRRHLGHNPLGGWMVVALLATLVAVCTSGWLFTTDWLWGYAWLSDTHVVLAWVLLGLLAVHVAGVLVTSRHQRENLVRAMVDGRKRPPDAEVEQ